MDYKQLISEVYGINESSFGSKSGYKESALKEVEDKLQLVLPEIIRNFYLSYGKIKALNYYDILFRPQDLIIDNVDGIPYLILGRGYPWHEFFGLKLNDILQDNPVIYRKELKMIEGTNRDKYVLTKDCTIENFLLDFLFDNGNNGGLKYRFNTYNSQETEKILHAINNNMLDVKLLDKISFINKDSTFYHNYYVGDQFILELLYDMDDHGKKGCCNFATNNKAILLKNNDILKINGIHVNKVTKTNRAYKIYRGEFPLIGFMYGLTIIPGSFDGWRERKDTAIMFPYESAEKFTDILHNVNNEFDYYGITTEYSKEQIILLIEQLTERIYEMKNNKKFMFHNEYNKINLNEYYFQNNIEYRNNKKQIIKVLIDFVDWLKNIDDDRINIIGA